MKDIDNKELILHNKKDLINFFKFSSYLQLNYLSFWNNSHSKKIYIKTRIPKRNWDYREILIPNDRLKQAQKHILKHILWFWIDKTLSEHAYGFVKEKSIYDNAKCHIWSKTLVKIDLENFFPTITQSRVYGMFRKIFNYNHIVSSYLSGLCTFDNKLPQWAPTSPAISNIIASKIDKRLLQYLSKIDNNISYSRYADDITIWLKNQTNIWNLIKQINNIIEEEWFLINYNKLRIINTKWAMKVTGLTINNWNVGVWRKRYKWIRAIIHNIKLNWRIKAKDQYVEYKQMPNISIENFKNIINWHINYISMINLKMWKKLKDSLS